LREAQPSIGDPDPEGLSRAPAPVVIRRGTDLRQLRELVSHLFRRELALAHRGTLLGGAWPLTRLLVQLAVLVFIFGHVVDLNIPDYPVFVLTGLIAWTWFATGVAVASAALLEQRHLVFQPNCPPVVLPVVSVTAPAFDVLVALPALVVLTALTGTFEPTVPLLIPLFAVQLVLMVGIAWIVAPISVYLRDVPNLVTVGLLVLFYLSPVFYAISRVPEQYQWVLLLNPMGTLIEAYRAVALGDPFPPIAAFIGVLVGSVVLAWIGLRVFRRLEGGLVDEL
jgi:lipopolysaccharide transport system permease protein